MRFPRFITLRSKEVRIYLAAIAALIIIFSFGAFAQARTFAQSQLYATGQGIQTALGFIFHKKGAMQREIDSLKERLAEQEKAHAEQAILTQENEELRNAIALIAARPSIFADAQIAYVVQRSSSTSAHVLQINRGSAEGILRDDIVTSAEGYLIGIIDSVNEHTSIVRLLQDAQTSVPANVLGTRSTTGLVQGKSGFVLELAFVPTDEELQEDLTVVTNGLEGRYPSGLVIGAVTDVKVTEKEPFKNARVTPFVDARDLITVLVL
jgi:rod shape-determining protein MreC